MAVEYQILIANTSGVTQSVAVDFLEIQITKQLNSPDLAAFSFDGNSQNIQFLTQGGFVSIYRKDDALGIPSTVEFSGYIARIVKIRGQKTTYNVTALGIMALLGTRIVAWKSGILNRSRWRVTPAETILKELFTLNIGVFALASNSRLLDGVTPGMVTTASTGAGAVLSMSAAYSNLLTAMQKVADAAGVYFTLTYTPPLTFTFVYLGSLAGTDRTSTVKLSVDNGTLAEVVVDSDLIGDFNAVIVGGAGEGRARRTAVRPAVLPTGYALRESFLDYRKGNKATVAQLQNEANARLRTQARKRLRFNANGVLQTAALRYGRDYFIGDKITLAEDGLEIPQIISTVTLEFLSGGEEKIDVEFTSV